MRGPTPTARGPRALADLAVRPRWRAPLVLAWLAPSLAASCGREPPHSSALLVTLDTTRADAIGTYGGPPGLTPRIDRLAREGIAWAAARTVAPLTLPAHASMLTGLVPPRHGVRTDGRAALPSSAETLAERARAAGLETAAFVAAPVLDERSGLRQGFDTWSQPPIPRPGEHADDRRGARAAGEVTASAVAWLRARPDPARPFFLWVHYFDPHTPWEAGPRFVELARGNPYLAEVAQVDEALGALLDALEELELLERTTVAVVGDHGEGLGEHGEATHGHFVFDATLRVPFVLRPALGGAGEERRGTADAGVASVVDVFPTLAHAMGLRVDAGSLDGIDLLAGPVPDERGAYFECYSGYLHLGWSPLAGWVDARGKYVHSSEPELYEPRAWPDERVNRIHERGEDELAPYRARLAEVAARPRLRPDPPGPWPDQPEPVLDDLAAWMAEPGQAAVGRTAASELPGPLDETGLPSPHARAGELEHLERARRQVLAGEHELAAESLRTIVEVNPLNVQALETLARQLLHLGEPEQALEVYERLLELAAPSAAIHAGMARALERAGRPEEAARRRLRLQSEQGR